MSFAPPEGRSGRERYLTYGGPGAGKSLQWVDIAMECARRGSKGRFFVLDTDAAVEDLFDELWPEGRDFITNFPVTTFEELLEATDEIVAAKPNSSNGDWVVVDLINAPWDWVQIYYAENIYGMTIVEYITETSRLIHEAKAAAKRAKSDGDKDKPKGHEREFGDWNTADWAHMKKLYLNWESSITLKGQAHVFACAEESEMNVHVSKARDIKDYSGTGGPVGFKPKGQNSLGHRFRTVTRTVKSGSEKTGSIERTIVMAKDRYREDKWSAKSETKGRNPGLVLGDTFEHQGFSKVYLRGIAGWEVVRGK